MRRRRAAFLMAVDLGAQLACAVRPRRVAFLVAVDLGAQLACALRSRRAAFLVAVGLGAQLACAGPAVPPCGAATCTGCCDAAGECVAGTSAATCGQGGAACLLCGGGEECRSGVCAAGTPADAGLEPWQEDLLREHNRVRANAQPAPAPPLQLLTWNRAAQAVATGWAANCRFEHNTGRGSYGENLFAGGGLATPSAVVQYWASEAPDYTWGTNTCAAGKQCGHYTQIVWRATTSVGCASQRCTANSPFGGTAPWFFWVCDYAPPGNVVGQKPY